MLGIHREEEGWELHFSKKRLIPSPLLSPSTAEGGVPSLSVASLPNPKQGVRLFEGRRLRHLLREGSGTGEWGRIRRH